MTAGVVAMIALGKVYGSGYVILLVLLDRSSATTSCNAFTIADCIPCNFLPVRGKGIGIRSNVIHVCMYDGSTYLCRRCSSSSLPLSFSLPESEEASASDDGGGLVTYLVYDVINGQNRALRLLTE